MIVGTFSGHVGRDAEIREYNGTKFVSFSVATNETLKSGIVRTQWVNVTFSNTKMAEHLKKGRQVMVIGRLSFSTYNNEPKIDCVATYLELLGKREA